MALRDQPYLPLYIQDFLTDEKLIECSPHATGIYIRLMCIMHKSEEYGTILLKQKDKQKLKQEENFALKLAKYMPYSFDEILTGLAELINEGVLQIEGDKLTQKRMVKDNYISIERGKAGKKGGEKTQSFAKAKKKANTENEIENEYDIVNNNINNSVPEISNVNSLGKTEIIYSDFENFRKQYPGTKRGYTTEFENLKKKHKDWKQIIPIVPEWKNLSTYINNRSWEEQITINKNEINKRNSRGGATAEDLAEIVGKHFATDYKQ
jgi:uncharacterized protein YdaU (DUF1376 family)